jgi:hypothetical protein
VKPHHLPPTTHTVEMAQVAEFNARLEAHHGPAITAAELGLEGARPRHHSSDALPGTAELVRVSWDGAPEFPDIHAYFTSTPGAGDEEVVVDLHTAALRALSNRLNLRHVWGVEDV